MPKKAVPKTAIRASAYRSLDRLQEQTRILYEHLDAERKRVVRKRAKRR